MFVIETIQCIRHFKFGRLIKKYRIWAQGIWFGDHKKGREGEKAKPTANYFSHDRIAVYTVIFGKYDKLLEPFCVPDNIDYYLVTDQEIDLSNSKWKARNISTFQEKLSKLSNAEKNRFFKMHPHLLFPEYTYTIYLDGNVQPVSDLTEFINKISDCGISAHRHSIRDCVFEEAKVAAAIGKDSKSNLERHAKHMEENGLPKHYGMLECNVLARKKGSPCNEIMEIWWKEFCSHSKRDQLSLPYVLYKFNIPISDVATLGPNVYENPAIRVYTHI